VLLFAGLGLSMLIRLLLPTKSFRRIPIPITIVIGLPNLFQNTGDAIVLVVQINNVIAHFTILFVLIVLGKFVQTSQTFKMERL